jgi:uncharacterized membrane protein
MQLSEENSEAPVWTLPMQLFFVGFFLAFIGFVVLIIATALQGNLSVSEGLIIFIGPIPIILGSGPYSVFAILLAVILTVIGFIVFFLLRKQDVRRMTD